MVANHVSTPFEGDNSLAPENRLVAAGWRDPAELVRVADVMALHYADFSDRLCGVLVGFLRICGEQEEAPSIAKAVAFLNHLSVPFDQRELESTISIIPKDAIVDLVGDVIHAAQDRTEDECRQITRDALRAIHHTFNCPRCLACARCASFQTTKSRNAARKPIYV